MKKQSGITLIALVVTIIVLIILAGISINLVLGENGIIQKSKMAKELSEEQIAREELEIEITSLSINKETGKEYTDEIFDNYLNNRDFVVNGDIVTNNGWQFQVDKSVPKIIASLGKGTEIEEIEITANVEYASDYTKANVKAVIVYEGKIVQIKVDGQEVEVPTKTDGKYEISKEILENGKHNIYIKDEDERYKIVSVTTTEISEDITIATPEELIAFRDRVNKGATYEGRTVTLIADLDLSSVCGESIGNWIPIGNYGTDQSHMFKGTFDGNNHTIQKIYINTTESRQGLFGRAENAVIKNLVISNTNIEASNFVATLVSSIASVIIENVHIDSNVTITATTPNDYGCYAGGLVGSSIETNQIIKSSNNANVTSNGYYAGGIAAVFSGTIDECYNGGIIKNNKGSVVGGIISINVGNNDTIISNCYNKGSINGYEMVGGILGCVHSTYNNVYITNCYNIGDVTGTGNFNISETVGYPIAEKLTITNCYTKSDEIIATNLGEAYVEDEDLINEGYPILKWQAK